ncbi:MAG: hypothetical protein RMM08_03050 [Armatimonadota bacterium]|nr:hypothetical protein [Armatimonadota bacterium]
MQANRWMMWLLIAALLLAIGALWAQPRVSTAPLTRTQRIELVDKNGKIRAELKASEENTLIVLYDGQGRLRTVVDIQSIAFYGEDGKLKAKIDAQSLLEGAGGRR